MKLNELLGTEFPFIQGGMANIATGEFAAAVSNAGALGLIGGGGMDAETLRMHIRQCRALTDKPFGVNIMLMNPAAPEMAKVVAEEGVKVVTTGAGLPTAYLPLWKEAGITVYPVVAASLVAKRLARSGIDGVIATNTTIARKRVEGLQHAQETGGLSGAPLRERSTEVVRLIADHVKGELPIIASGGVMTGKDAVEKMEAGAQLVQLFTGFIYNGPKLVADSVEAVAAWRRAQAN